MSSEVANGARSCWGDSGPTVFGWLVMRVSRSWLGASQRHDESILGVGMVGGSTVGAIHDDTT
jgi:hypothetical protein